MNVTPGFKSILLPPFLVKDHRFTLFHQVWSRSSRAAQEPVRSGDPWPHHTASWELCPTSHLNLSKQESASALPAPLLLCIPPQVGTGSRNLSLVISNHCTSSPTGAVLSPSPRPLCCMRSTGLSLLGPLLRLHPLHWSFPGHTPLPSLFFSLYTCSLSDSLSVLVSTKSPACLSISFLPICPVAHGAFSRSYFKRSMATNLPLKQTPPLGCTAQVPGITQASQARPGPLHPNKHRVLWDLPLLDCFNPLLLPHSLRANTI